MQKDIYECIDSILNQTYGYFELLLIDNGKDNLPQVYYEYANKDKRIKVFHQNNVGESISNRDLDKTYIWFVDSDDWIEPHSIRTLTEKLAIQEYDMIRFDAVDHYSDYSKKRVCQHTQGHVYDRRQLLLENRFLVCFPFHIIKREFLLENKLFFLEGIFYEDQELMIKVIDKCKSFIYLEEVFYNVTKRKESTTRTTNYERALDIEIGVNSHINYMDSSSHLQEDEKGIFIDNIKSEVLSLLVRTVDSKDVFCKAVRWIRQHDRLKQIIGAVKTDKYTVLLCLTRFPNLLRFLLKKRVSYLEKRANTA